MKQLLGFKTQLKVNNKQATLLAKHAGVARHAYNWGLDVCKQVLAHNRENLEQKQKFPSAIALHKKLVAEVKAQYPWYYETSKCAPQYALRNLSDAFSRFFKMPEVGFPRRKKKFVNDSFTLDGSISVTPDGLKLPRIGKIRTYETLMSCQPKSVTITRKADRWYVSFKIEVEANPTPKIYPVVGVDLGIKLLATLSTGVIFEGIKAYNRAQARLKRLQRRVYHKTKGGSNRRKAITKLAKLHGRVASIRKDMLNQLTTYLAKNHGVIGIENLNVSGMLKNHKLAKAVADMGFYEFRRQLEYKAKLYGSKVIVVDRWLPSTKTCNKCSHIQDMPLSVRIYECEKCGYKADRDFNAALNLEDEVKRLLALTS